ncbi:MAG TPA: rhodanese-like domain-containing protein [Acidimicrobiia bacterium]|nr:rhodanese-like domain-containing protein [Acidimicrobiia bacterium]
MGVVSTAHPTEIGPEEAQRMAAEGAFLLDVREPHEWHVGHVEGAVHIPMRMLDARQGELPGDRPIVAVCRSGARSGRVAEALRQAGYDAVNLAGGLQAWVAVDLPLVADDEFTDPHVA